MPAATLKMGVLTGADTNSYSSPTSIDDTIANALFEDDALDAAFFADKVAAGAIPGAALADNSVDAASIHDVAAPTIVGTPTVPVQFEVIVAAGATADVGTFTAPWKCRLVDVSVYKTAANGGAGDLFEVETAAGGAGANISTADLNVNDTFRAAASLNDAVIDIASGATIHFRRTTVTDGACRAVLTFHKHT